MGVSEIIASIDREIAGLTKARELLAGGASENKRATRGSHTQPAAKPARAAGRKKSRLSPEGRRRIAEAVKRRWAAQRKAAAGPKKEAVAK